MIKEIHNLPIILCGIFYSILCVLSIVNGFIYISGKKKLNSLQLSDKFMKMLNNEEKLHNFIVKIGWITFIEGIMQGLTALAIFIGYNKFLNLFVLGFTIFSIFSIIFKLKSKSNIFPIIKLIFYLLILGILLLNGVNNYRAEKVVLKYLKSSNNVKVSKIKEGYFFDGRKADKAIIFYPGARVQYTSYAKLMYKLADNGYDCFLIAFPFNLAFFGINKSESIMKKYNYDSWYLSGHSLGGVAASLYVTNNSDKVKGIINFASYPMKKLPENIKYISIYGSEDKVLNIKKFKDSEKYLPKNYQTYVINGGNHAGFANYGSQHKDSKAKITSDEQQDYAIQKIIEFMS